MPYSGRMVLREPCSRRRTQRLSVAGLRATPLDTHGRDLHHQARRHGGDHHGQHHGDQHG